MKTGLSVLAVCITLLHSNELLYLTKLLIAEYVKRITLQPETNGGHRHEDINHKATDRLQTSRQVSPRVNRCEFIVNLILPESCSVLMNKLILPVVHSSSFNSSTLLFGCQGQQRYGRDQCPRDRKRCLILSLWAGRVWSVIDNLKGQSDRSLENDVLLRKKLPEPLPRTQLEEVRDTYRHQRVQFTFNTSVLIVETKKITTYLSRRHWDSALVPRTAGG